MAHDTHHTATNTSKVPSISSFWLILILAGVFVAAVNFVNVMSHDDGGHGEESHAPSATHQTSGMLEAKDAPADAMHEESGMHYQATEDDQPHADH